MPDEIHIAPYDPKWSIVFQTEKTLLQQALDDNLIDIQHIGSTAVPGLPAKPIIDIMIIVKSLINAKTDYPSILKKLDYVYWTEDPKANKRMFLVKGMPPYGNLRTHHLHIIQPDNYEFMQRSNFVEYLCKHAEIVKEYEKVKPELHAAEILKDLEELQK